MGLCLVVACNPIFWSGRLKKIEPRAVTINDIKLIASVPSLLQAHPSINTLHACFLEP